MSFIADKKREHETAAEQALVEKDYARAFFHTAKAAEFGLALAEQSEGKIAERYVEDAFDLIDIAGQLKTKAQTQAPVAARKAIKEAKADDDSPQTQWELKDKPTEKLDDVAGLDAVKQELQEKVIEPFLHPELYDDLNLRTGGGILMYGPPGNGKTFIARAIAGTLDAAFFNVNFSQIKDKYVGETEKKLQQLFDAARQHPKAVIFLDEVDHLLGKRGNRKIGAVTQFLTLMDGFAKNTNCLLVLAGTNKPWFLDEAVIRPGRLGTHIYVGLPDAKARAAIIAFHIRGAAVCDDIPYDEIVAKTEGYSGADVAELCDRAKTITGQRRRLDGQKHPVSTADFMAALEKVGPSVTPEAVKKFEAWRDGGASPAEAEGEDE